MTLKTATLIAIICLGLNTLLYGLSLSGIVHWSQTFSIIRLILSQGGILIFLITLYTKQK